MNVYRVLLPLVASLLLAPLPSALAWGPEGHRITAKIAGNLLTAKARHRLSRLMQGEDLATSATYPDTFKTKLDTGQLGVEYRGSRKSHYDDRPVCDGVGTIDKAEWCKSDRCASAQLPDLYRQMIDVHESPANRIMAVRFVVHLVGDIHQPLHAGEYQGDGGGNNVSVSWKVGNGVRSDKFPSFWDNYVVKNATRGSNEDSLATDLAGKYAQREADWSVGGFEDWIQETNELGRSFAYGQAPGFECGKDFVASELTQDYVAQANDIVLVQLAKGGVRLAHILNRAFGY
jgi:hypothetical protein